MVSRKNANPKEEQSPNGVYYTPDWLIRLWKDHYEPRHPRAIVDVGAGDGRIGRAFDADIMLDLTPRAPDVFSIDIYGNVWNSPLVRYKGCDLSIVTNPPYGGILRWVTRCLELCGSHGEVCVLMRCGVLQLVSWSYMPYKVILPQHRVSFEVEEEYALEVNARRAARGKSPSAFKDPTVPTGWKLGSPGDDHGIFVFRPDWFGDYAGKLMDAAPYLRTPGEVCPW